MPKHVKVTFEIFHQKLKDGGYQSAGAARKAIAKASLTAKEKSLATKAIDDYFSGNPVGQEDDAAPETTPEPAAAAPVTPPVVTRTPVQFAVPPEARARLEFLKEALHQIAIQAQAMSNLRTAAGGEQVDFSEVQGRMEQLTLLADQYDMEVAKILALKPVAPPAPPVPVAAATPPPAPAFSPKPGVPSAFLRKEPTPAPVEEGQADPKEVALLQRTRPRFGRSAN